MNTVEKYRRYVTTSAFAAVEPITVESARGRPSPPPTAPSTRPLFRIGVVNAGHVPPKVAEAAKRADGQGGALLLVCLSRPRRGPTSPSVSRR